MNNFITITNYLYRSCYYYFGMGSTNGPVTVDYITNMSYYFIKFNAYFDSLVIIGYQKNNYCDNFSCFHILLLFENATMEIYCCFHKNIYLGFDSSDHLKSICPRTLSYLSL